MKNKIVKIDYGNIDYFPALVDYDFVNNRSRGGSSRIDFFSFGKVSSSFDGIDVKSFVFMKKQDTFFEKGVILVDFSKLENNMAEVIKMINDMKFKTLYIEDSVKFSVEKLIEKLPDVEIILMNFVQEDA